MTINPAFQRLIPPLAPEELAQLEANILADGCRDPLVTWNGTLLDGHNRFEICRRHGVDFDTKAIQLADDDDAKVWIIRNQFGRRNIADFTRVELVLKLEPLLKQKAKANQANGSSGKGKPLPHNCAKADTRSALAKIAGVSPRLIDEGRIVDKHADEATKKKLRENQISVHRVAKEIKERNQRESRAQKRQAAAKAVAHDDRVIIGDFRQNADKLADGSVSLIFTDPPYDREASKMLPALAAFAKSKLADGGSMLCYVGQTQIPAALDAFRLHLRYWWTVACVHAGRSTVMREYGVNAGWKAVLWFVKGTRDNNSVMVSDVMSGGEEKTHHDWQQAESEAAYWIEKLCPEDGLVCDPFLGGGTTAVAANRLNRKWVGFEIDPVTAGIASERIGS